MGSIPTELFCERHIFAFAFRRCDATVVPPCRRQHNRLQRGGDKPNHVCLRRGCHSQIIVGLVPFTEINWSVKPSRSQTVVKFVLVIVYAKNVKRATSIRTRTQHTLWQLSTRCSPLINRETSTQTCINKCQRLSELQEMIVCCCYVEEPSPRSRDRCTTCRSPATKYVASERTRDDLSIPCEHVLAM